MIRMQTWTPYGGQLKINPSKDMTIQRIAPNAWVVSHAGQSATFIGYNFIMMVDWATRMQRLAAAGV